MLKGAAAAIAEMHARRRHATRAIDGALDDAAKSAAIAFSLQADEQSVARRSIGNEDRLPGRMPDTVAAMPQAGDIDLDLWRIRWRRLGHGPVDAFLRHILLLS